MKSYGRAPTFLLATGYEQVRSVVAALVGDWEAARDVQLNLPETGVCSTDWATDDSGTASACCGTSSEKVTNVAFEGVVSLNTISVHSTQLQPISAQTVSRDCGCADTCCADGSPSLSCGCDSSCCS
jgi:hypothetical protein